jgi:hypothetical protein
LPRQRVLKIGIAVEDRPGLREARDRTVEPVEHRRGS